MKTQTVLTYDFDELSDASKARACDAWRARGVEYFWRDDAKRSLETFADFFGVRIKDYEVGAYSYSYVTTDAENRNFRGRKLRDFDPDHMPTGYCADYPLWNTFHSRFKETGDALRAFNDAVDAWVGDVVADMEYQQSDEAIAETLRANEYQFTGDGKFWP